jgi:hypothetical protein
MDDNAFAEITCKSSHLCRNFCKVMFPNSLNDLRLCLCCILLTRFSVPLLPNTLFVLEAFVPDLARFDRGQRVGAREVETDRHRWAGWAQEPFTATSGSHVSVYARAT